MTLGLSKQSLNIIKINEKQNSKKRKLNELMSDNKREFNNIYNLENFQQINYNNDRSYESNYETPSKRSRNNVCENMTSNNNINANSEKSSKSTKIFQFFNTFWEKFKFKKNGNNTGEESLLFHTNDNNRNQLTSHFKTSSDASLEMVSNANQLNYSNKTNINDFLSNDINASRVQNLMIEKTENDNHLDCFQYNKSLFSNKSPKVLNKSVFQTKKKSKTHLNSFDLEDRENYKILLNSHISGPQLHKMGAINSLHSSVKRVREPELIDLSCSVSADRTTYGSRSSHNISSNDGFIKEKVDNPTKNYLVDRIRSAGIVAKPFVTLNTISSTPFGIKSAYNENTFSTPSQHSFVNNRELQTQLPESSKKFNDMKKDKKNLFETNWVHDLKTCLNQSQQRLESRISQSEQKVLETKNKRETDYQNLGSYLRVPYTRTELSPFVPFCQFQERIDHIEEEDEEEEDSIAKDLPVLTPEMEQMIDDALRPTPPNDVLSDAFSITITRKDMETLSGLNWLNDEVINFYMSLIVERSKNDNYSNAYAFNTFFYPKLKDGGHKVLKRWTRKVDVFAHDFIFIPIHLGMHWCLAVINFIHKRIEYYDSMGGKNNECIQALKFYLQEESLDKKKVQYDMSDWTLENVKEIPQQMNGSDCGMFTCKYAEYISRKAKINFSQAHMPYFRRRMVYEILTKKLL